MVLVDTSIWLQIEREHFDLGGRVPLAHVAVCPPIVQEVLQGCREEWRYQRHRAALMDAFMIEDPMSLEVFEDAAQLFRRCGVAGYNFRSGMDCLIAVCAIRNDAALLSLDSDFEIIAQFAPLRLL